MKRILRALFSANSVLISLSFIGGIGALYVLTVSTRPPLAITVLATLGAILCIGSLIALKSPTSVKNNLAMSALSLISALFLAEAVLLLVEPLEPSEQLENSRFEAADKAGVHFDRRSKLEVVRDFRSSGVAAVPSVPPSWGLNSLSQVDDGSLFPLSGKANSLTVHCNETGDWLVFESDAFGFNNPPEVTARPSLDIVALGDSFVMGNCAPDGADVPSQMRKLGLEVGNFGYGGNGPLLQLATLREYAAKYKPKHLLWFIYEGNDFNNLALERSASILTSYLRPEFNQNLVAKELERDKAITRVIEQKYQWHISERSKENPVKQFLRLSLLRERIRALVPTPVAGDGLTMDILFAEYQDILLAATSEVSRWNGQLHIVYLPDWGRYNQHQDGSSPQSSLPVVEEAIVKIATELDIPLINIRESFVAAGDPLQWFPWRLRGHYTAAGYELIAREVAKHLAAFQPVSDAAAANKPSTTDQLP